MNFGHTLPQFKIGLRPFCGLLLSGLLTSATVSGASAEQISKQDAQLKVAAFAIQNSQILQKYPSFTAIEAAVLGDCHEHAPKDIDWVSYCSCGKNMTMVLWMSGIDKNMVTRLEDYAANPKPDSASDFLKYQGPELYAPLCQLASGTN